MMFAGRLTPWTLLTFCALGTIGYVQAQESDIARLIHPDVAERLSLDDVQRAKIQQLLLDRAQALARETESGTAGDEKRAAIKSKYLEDIRALLTPEQIALWSAPQPTQKLMFQFREMKWDDVLNWFASQQDLTLVMDRTPTGTFTYSDSRAYTPSEGIDLLNSVLMTRGFTLVHREKMLMVMELTDNIPLELLPRIPLEELDQRGRFEIVSVLFPLAGRPVDAVLQEVKPYLSTYGRAIPLARGGQLLVVETAGKMRTINELIASVPLPKEEPKPAQPEKPPQPIFAAYPLGELDGGAALEAIRKLIPSEQITVDGRTGVLSAFVIPEQQTAIKLAIDQMLSSHSALPDSSSVAYRFTGIKPEDLQQQIAGLAPRATVTVTPNRVLVTADAADQRVIREALAALDIQPVAGERNMRVLEVSKTSADQIGTALRTFLPNSFVVSNVQAGSVLVRGSDEDLGLAQEIVDIWRQSQGEAQAQLHTFELDRPATAAWLATVQQIVPDAKVWLSDPPPATPQHLMLLGNSLDIAAVEKILPQLLSVLPQGDRRALKIYPLTDNQRARQASLVSLPGELSTIKLVTGQGGEELLVWASPEQHRAFSELLSQLDQPLNTGTIVPRSYDLQVKSTGTVTQLLTAEFPGVALSVSTDGDQLTALATIEQHARIAQRIAEFNSELPVKPEMVVESYSVEGMTAAALQQMLTPLLTTAQTTIDSKSERLVIRADTETHTELRALVAELESKPNAGKQKVVIAYHLAHATASNVKLLLDQIVRDATILADDKLRQVVVSGSLQTQATVKASIEQIDQAGSAKSAVQLRSYDAGQLKAPTLIASLQGMWPNMQFAADSSTNQVLAAGTELEQAEVEVAIRDLISASGALSSTVYALRYGNPATAATVLARLLPQATLVPDLASKTLSATAKAGEHTTIAEFMVAFDRPQVNDKETRVYRLQRGSPRGLSSVLGGLMPDGIFYGSNDAGGLIATALPEQHERIAALVKEFDIDRENTQTRVFTIGHGNASSLQNAIRALASQATVTSDTASNSLIVTGTEDELSRISEIIEQVEKGGSEPRSTRFYPVTGSDPNALSQALMQSFPKATLTADQINGGLFITATESEHEELLKVVEGLNSHPTRLPTLKSFVLKHASPEVVADAIDDAFGRRSAAGVSFNLGTRSVFVVGSREDLQVAQTLVEQIDVAPPDRRLEIVQLEATDPYSFKLAADALFEDEPSNTAPSISVDNGQQRVMIRATDSQLAAVRQLLEQMGEMSGGATGANHARLRIVPVHRNSEKLLQEIQRLWPAAAGNVIEIIRPTPSVPQKSNNVAPDPQNNHPLDRIDDRSQFDRPSDSPAAKLTSTTQTDDNDTSLSIQDDAAGEESTEVGQSAGDPKGPPIIVVVGEEQWTVASADTKALDQFQRLLDALLNPRTTPLATTGNYSVYLLRHAGAEQMQELLSDLFRPERGRISTASDLMQRVKVVADARINALIVSGNRQDRRAVEDLLGVLDSEDLLDSLQQITPTTLALESASASNVEKILRDVYRAQLSSGAGRRPVAIPEGISSDVASLLQQINAQSSGPLLTLAADETSNSIIFRAPLELTSEIRTFVESLDRKSQEAPSKRVDLIRLQSTNTKSLQQALRILLAK